MEQPEAMTNKVIDMVSPNAIANANGTPSYEQQCAKHQPIQPISYDPSDSDVESNTINRLISRTATYRPDSHQTIQRRTDSWLRRYKTRKQESKFKVYTSDDEPIEPLILANDTSLTDTQRLKKLPRPSQVVPDIERGITHDAGMTESERTTYARLLKATTLRIKSLDRNGSIPPIAAMTRSHFGLDDYTTFLVPPSKDRELIIKRVPKNLLSRYYRGKALTRLFSRRVCMTKKGQDAHQTESAPSDYIADFEYWCPSDVFETAERKRVSQREKTARRAARAKARSAASKSRALAASKALAAEQPEGKEDENEMIWTIKADALQLLHDSQSSDGEGRASGNATPERRRDGDGLAAGAVMDELVSWEDVDCGEVTHEGAVDDGGGQAGVENHVADVVEENAYEDSSEDSERGNARQRAPPTPPSPMSPQPLFDKLLQTLETDPGAIINIPEVKPEGVIPAPQTKSEDDIIAKEEPKPVTVQEQEQEQDGTQAVRRKRRRKKRKVARVTIDESTLSGFEKEKYLAMMYCQAPVGESRACGVPVQYVGNRAAGRGRKRKQADSSQPAKRLRSTL